MPVNNKIIRLLVTSTSLILFLISISILRSCKKTKAAKSTRIIAEKAYKQAQKNNKPKPEIILNDTNLYLLGKNNIKNCIIQAEKSKMFPNNNEVECTNIDCKLTTKNNEIVILHAPKAYINNTTKSMFLPGPVEGTFKDWNLQKEDILYEAQKHMISAHNIKIQSHNAIIQAEKSKIHLEKEKIKLDSGVFSCFER